MKKDWQIVVRAFLLVLIVVIVTILIVQLGDCAVGTTTENVNSYIIKVQLPDRINDCYVYAPSYGAAMWCFDD